MENKKKIISCGKCSLKLLIPFVFPFFIKLRRLIRDIVDNKKDGVKKNPYIKVFINYLSFVLAGLLYLIVLCRSKKSEKN